MNEGPLRFSNLSKVLGSVGCIAIWIPIAAVFLYFLYYWLEYVWFELFS